MNELTGEECQASRLAADLSRLPIKSRLVAMICSTSSIDELDQIARAPNQGPLWRTFRT